MHIKGGTPVAFVEFQVSNCSDCENVLISGPTACKFAALMMLCNVQSLLTISAYISAKKRVILFDFIIVEKLADCIGFRIR